MQFIKLAFYLIIILGIAKCNQNSNENRINNNISSQVNLTIEHLTLPENNADIEWMTSNRSMVLYQNGFNTMRTVPGLFNMHSLYFNSRFLYEQ